MTDVTEDLHRLQVDLGYIEPAAPDDHIGLQIEAAARSDLGNAQIFVAQHQDQLRYVAQHRRWMVWDGQRWRPDDTGDATRAAKTTVQALLEHAVKEPDTETRKAATRWALTSQSERGIRGMLNLASTESEIVTSATELDGDPFLFACANGTINLRTGELRASDPRDLITRGTDVPYHPAATCPRWEQFLREVFADDPDLIAFMQRLAGYSLTGSTREHVIAVLYGSGGNGKTTLIETLKRIVGEHATTAEFTTFTKTRGDRGPRNDLARLAGARLVVAPEGGSSARLDEATVKEITGGDKITARFLFGEHFEFHPEFKLWLVSNHKPGVDADDDAVWRRLRLIPFTESFEGREDDDLDADLEAELSGILAWAVRGCLAWQRDGLGRAEAVTQATSEYRAEEDHLGAFLAEATTTGGQVLAADLRGAYEEWCSSLGERPLSGIALGKRLRKKGIDTGRAGKGRRTYVGISLAEGCRVTEGDTKSVNLPHAGAYEVVTDKSVTTRHPTPLPLTEGADQNPEKVRTNAAQPFAQHCAETDLDRAGRLERDHQDLAGRSETANQNGEAAA